MIANGNRHNRALRPESHPQLSTPTTSLIEPFLLSDAHLIARIAETLRRVAFESRGSRGRRRPGAGRRRAVATGKCWAVWKVGRRSAAVGRAALAAGCVGGGSPRPRGWRAMVDSTTHEVASTRWPQSWRHAPQIPSQGRRGHGIGHPICIQKRSLQQALGRNSPTPPRHPGTGRRPSNLFAGYARKTYVLSRARMAKTLGQPQMG